MSPKIKKFYQSYKAWLDRGAPKHKPYSRSSGLCFNAGFIDNCSIPVLTEMQKQFEEAGLDKAYPFGKDEYKLGIDEETQHLNKARNSWVEEHAK